MRFGFTDDQRLFQSTVRDLLQKECTPELVRELWSSETGRSPELWSALADMGVVGLLVPVEHGGLGAGFLDLVLLLEESGRVALPAPLVETAAVAVPALLDSEIGAYWLPLIAAGDAVVTVGFGDKPLVSDAHVADLLLLERDGQLHAVERAGVTIEPHRSVDRARRLFSVDWSEGSAIGPSAPAFDRAALGAAAQLLGLAQHLLDTTVEYAGVREQFGAPIGSFQAVKHHLANALLAIEFARPLVYRAAATVAPVDVSMAKAAASDAASLTAGTALQVHGAIGYTFEYDLQLWMKRVWALAAAWGDAPSHRRRVADHLLGPCVMRAYRVLEWERPPELVEVDVPTAGRGQVVVKVAGNGLCHSDAMMSQIPGSIGELLGWHVPFTLGHEIAGHIHEVGDGVTGIESGDAVALVSPTSCGACRYCVRGQDSACPNGVAGRGYGRDGGLAEYVLVESTRSLLPLGDLDPLSAAPLTDAGATAYHAVRRVVPRLPPGSTAVVIGAGGLGSFAVQFLRVLTPATVIAIDTNDDRLEVAADLGAHEVRRELSEPAVADVVLDFVGVDDTIRAGAIATRPYGAFGVVGAAGGTFKGPWYGGLPRDADVFTFQGSCISDAQDVLALARDGLIRSEFDPYPLDRIADAYDALEHGRLRGRAVVTP